jgi:hypothetical protein
LRKISARRGEEDASMIFITIVGRTGFPVELAGEWPPLLRQNSTD